MHYCRIVRNFVLIDFVCFDDYLNDVKSGITGVSYYVINNE